MANRVKGTNKVSPSVVPKWLTATPFPPTRIWKTILRSKYIVVCSYITEENSSNIKKEKYFMEDRMQEKTQNKDKRDISSNALENRKGKKIPFRIIASLLGFAILLPSLWSVRRWKNKQWKEILANKKPRIPNSILPRIKEFQSSTKYPGHSYH